MPLPRVWLVLCGASLFLKEARAVEVFIMIFLKHVRHKLSGQAELESILVHVREMAAQVPGVRLRECFVLQARDEFILVMECPDEAAYQEWRETCPPPAGARDWVEAAVLAEEFA